MFDANYAKYYDAIRSWSNPYHHSGGDSRPYPGMSQRRIAYTEGSSPAEKGFFCSTDL
jgi:hypothetical protein